MFGVYICLLGLFLFLLGELTDSRSGFSWVQLVSDIAWPVGVVVMFGGIVLILHEWFFV